MVTCVIVKDPRRVSQIHWTRADRGFALIITAGDVGCCFFSRGLFLPRSDIFAGFLGPSSTWAYTRQVIVDIQQHFNEPSIPEIPLHVDGNAYMFDWSDAGDVPFTKAELPSLDYAIYLMNTVQFHIAQLYHLFDQKSFMNGLYQFYDCTVPEPPKSKLWYIQYLLVISFGKSFLMQKTAKEPLSGVVFFARAMKLLPNIQGLYDDPLLSMEILCAASLYLQCLDHRNNAYVYVSGYQTSFNSSISDN